MGNNSTQNSKLDETVKESLNNYEAKYDAGDWSRMERMLDAAPKTIVSSVSYGKIAIIGAAVILGGFLVYKAVNSSSPAGEKQTTTTPAVETQPEKQPAAVVPSPATSTTPAQDAANTAVTTPSTTTVTSPASGSPTAVPSIADKASAEKTKKDQKNKDNEAEYNKNQKVTVMGNEPIFGDMIDSSKGVIHETKEKESTKKAAKNKGTGAIGLSGLLNIHLNLDSLNKYNESKKKDSIH
ncbi:MAG: hypothetical protein ACJ77K_13785 [Bacteroidia bacterium]